MAVEQPLELGEGVVGGEPAGLGLAAGLDDADLAPRASNRRNGSVPRKLNRPTFSPPMTLSNRNDGAVRSIRRKAETGVRPSPVNWR